MLFMLLLYEHYMFIYVTLYVCLCCCYVNKTDCFMKCRCSLHTTKQDFFDNFLLEHIFHRNKIYHLISIETKQKYSFKKLHQNVGKTFIHLPPQTLHVQQPSLKDAASYFPLFVVLQLWFAQLVGICRIKNSCLSCLGKKSISSRQLTSSFHIQ